MSAPQGKRKKKSNTCPNPLFVQWLTEWRDEAAEQGLKSKFQYQKALATLKKYPLVLETGKEAKILENFGDKICKRLDDKLAEYVSEYGTTEPVPGVITVNLGKAGGRSKPYTVPGGIDLNALTIPPPPPGCISVDSGSDDESRPARPKQRRPSGRRPSGPREYRPPQGSGPYALLVTLYNDLQSPICRGFMSKRDLMDAAQPLCNTSFTIPDPGSRYTAWSSMGTLVKKGYVIKESSPAKYSLTNAGCELAYKLMNETGDVHHDVQMDPVASLLGKARGPRTKTSVRTPPRTSGALGAVAAVLAKAGSPAKTTTSFSPVKILSSPSGSRKRNFSGFHDICEPVLDIPVIEANNTSTFPGAGQRLGGAPASSGVSPLVERFRGVGHQLGNSSVPRAGAVNTDSDLGISCRMVHTLSDSEDDIDALPDLTERLFGKHSSSVSHTSVSSAAASSSLSSGMNSPPDPNLAFGDTESSLGLKFWYISESGENVWSKDQAAVLIDVELSVGFLIKCKYEDLLMCMKRYKLDTSRPGEGEYIFAHLQDSDAPDRSNPDVSLPVEKIRTSTSQPITLGRKEKQKTATSTVTSNTSKAVVPTPAFSIPATANRLKPPKITSSQESTTSSTYSVPEPDFSFPPGTFDIILCIDNQEHFTGSKISRTVLLPELNKCAVKYDVRKLNVGDFLWVARERTFGNPRELVLDYIVERKRMDDLAGSIVDGRFREQKFRMRSCGLKQAIYLVEKYGSPQHFSITEDRLAQAVANTQVIDDFYVKRTQDMKESVAYLAIMTRYMQSIYSGKTLVAVKKSTLEDSGVVNVLDHAEQHLMTFQEFNQASLKTKALTVSEMFGKQLLQMNGMTAEKASAILEQYPTPACLLQAYQNCLSIQQKENLLADIKFGPSALKRKIGAALSKSVSLLYTAETALA